MKINDITAVILAGGKNTRLRKEKSLLKIDGDYLIDIQLKVLRQIFDEIMISTGKPILKEKYSEMKLIADEYENCGPLGGVHAALKHCETDAIFTFACDMPFLNAKLIRLQINEFYHRKVQIIVPSHIEGIEPLHAIYSKTTLPYLEECLKIGRLSVRSFYKFCKTGYLDIEPAEIRYFYNINTPEDLSKVM